MHSDFIVYVDESGDHSLESINPRYPLFVLTFCVFQKRYYCHVATPALRMLKFATFGHDMIVLHEQEIRKKSGPFHKLSKEPRAVFLTALADLIAQTDFRLISVIIDKNTIACHSMDSIHVYHLAMRLGLEKLYQLLQHHEAHHHHTHIVFEARGRKEDLSLENEFRHVCDGNNSMRIRLPFEIIFADKKANSEGLQFADMVARPVGLSVLRPDQYNYAYEIIAKKLYQKERIIFPEKAKGLKVSLEAQAPVG